MAKAGKSKSPPPDAEHVFAATPAKARNSPRRWHIVLALLPLLATGFVYRDSFQGPMVFDDQFAIERNDGIRHLDHFLDAAFGKPHSPLSGRPVSALTFALNFHFGQLQRPGYHAVNLGIHLLAGLFLWGVAYRTLCAPNVSPRLAPAAPWLATLIAALWLLHPLQTEPVEYLTQRTSLLMGMFLLATLYAAARSWTSPRPVRWQVVAVVCCALGMGSKEDMIAAPLLVVLYEATFFASSWSDAFTRRGKFYLALAGTWGLLAIFVTLAPFNETVGFGQKMNISGDEYLYTQARAIGRYLRLSVWPQPLILAYDWKKTTSPFQVWPQGLLILGLLAVSLWGVVSRRWWGALGAWFFLILAPTSSVLPIATEYVAERRMYLPVLSIIVLAVMLAYAIWRQLVARWPRAERGLNVAGVLVAILAVTVVGYGSWLRLGDYKNELTLWLDTVAKAPNSSRVQVNLASAYSSIGDADKAVQHLEAALRMESGNFEAYSNLSLIYRDRHEYKRAIEVARRSVAENPNNGLARVNLVFALLDVNLPNEALEEAEYIIRQFPNMGLAYNARGAIWARFQRFQEAEADFHKAIALDPSDMRPHYNLGKLLMNRYPGTEGVRLAIPHFEAGLRAHPEDAEGHTLLGDSYLLLGDPARALTEYRAALQMRPHDKIIQSKLQNLQQATPR